MVSALALPMSYIALVVVVFYLNGEPEIFSKIVPASEPCNYQEALKLVNERVSGASINNDYILWRCDRVTSPGPVELAPSRNAVK